MSPFGLFDLLKTLLPQASPSNAPPDAAETETQPPAPTQPHANSSAPPNFSPQNTDFSTENPPKNNACADFLYRHERLSQSMKGTKKRSD